MGRPRKNECQRVQSNLIQGEVFVRRPVSVFDIATTYEEKKYYELQRKTVANGIQEQLVPVSYPITPESVKSYAASTDYKRDFTGNQRSGGVNIGENAEKVQKIISGDTAEAKALYDRLQALATQQNTKAVQGTQNEQGEQK